VNSSDRPQFDEQMALLCAGYNVPLSVRPEAYWKGMAKMSLVEFARAVEYALSEDGPDKIPNTKALWAILRGLKKRAQRAPEQPKVEPEDSRDHLLYLANRMFLRHVVNRGGLGSTSRFVPGYGLVDCKASAELVAARNAIRDVVDWFCAPVREGDLDATPAAFIDQYIRALEKVSKIDPRTQAAWERQRDDPRSQQPFEPHMGRDIAQQPRLVYQA
jgi:hypothetical protein